MNAPLLTFGYVAVLATACSAQPGGPPPPPPPPPTRAITLAVTVKDETGAPLSGICLFASAENEGLFGRTGSDGVASITGSIRSDRPRVFVIQGPNETATKAQLIADIDRWKQVIKDYVFASKYVVPLTADDHYMLTITAPHAVKVSGLLLNAHSEPRTGVRLYQLDSACDTQSNDVGQFQLAGIRPNADTDIIFNAFPDGSRNILHLTASQTASDFNMGSLIVSAPPTPDSVVHFALTHVADLLPDISTKDTGISLISTDFQHLFAFGVNADGSVKPARGMTATKVIAGTYFVVSGFPQDNQELGKVIRMLRAGKASVLQAASVASVTATADHDTNVTVDVAANETAVRAVQE